MWLMGRHQPLNIHGLPYTLDRVEKMMGLYGWSEWPDFFPVAFHRLPDQALVPVIECAEFRVLASPVQHFIPTIGLRIEFVASGKILAYSSDTGPCVQELQLAAGADILVHEASGALPGHSSAAQAGQAARQAGVGSLVLIHYPTGQFATGDPLAQARRQFDGPVTLAEDYMVLDFPT
jgi:ribonuclease Z